jgi:hypothetical protein
MTVYDTYQTAKSLSDGSLSLGQFAKDAAADIVVSATIGKAGGKLAKKLLGRGCSFDGATLVHTDDGLLRIDQVRPGMSVLSGDPVTGNTSYQTVLDQYSNDYDKTVYITYEGMDGPEEITSNTIHPFFVVLDETTPRLVAQSAEGHIYEGPIKGGAWLDAAHLRPGHNLRTPDGTLRKVLTVNITAEPLTAYNLTVDQTETYFVGEEPVWVHNCPKWPKGRVTKISSEKIASPAPKPDRAPIGVDDKPIELHHEAGADGPLVEMTREEHRIGKNFRKNHPSGYEKLTGEERKAFDKEKRAYWRERNKELEADNDPDRDIDK